MQQQQQQRFTFLLAAVFATIAGLLFWFYLKSLDKPVSQTQMRIVFTAAKDITARTALTPAMLESVSRPSLTVDADAVSSLAEVKDKIALTTIPEGAVITKSRISGSGTAPVATTMRLGTRAVTISIDPVRGVANLVLPGDRVDVMAIQKGADASQGAKVTTIMRGATVLAMGKTTEAVAFANRAAGSDPTQSDATTVTLALNPKDAEELETADATSTLRLALRPALEKTPKVISQPYVVLTPPPAAKTTQGVASAPAAHEAPATVKAMPSAAHQIMGITVIDGDHVIGEGK